MSSSETLIESMPNSTIPTCMSVGAEDDAQQPEYLKLQPPETRPASALPSIAPSALRQFIIRTVSSGAASRRASCFAARPTPLSCATQPARAEPPSLLQATLDEIVSALRCGELDPCFDVKALPMELRPWILRYAVYRKAVGDATLEALLPGHRSAHLSLRMCSGVTDVGLATIVRLRPQLRTIDLRGCSGITAAGLQLIVRGLPELELLSVSGCPAVRDETIPQIFKYHNPPHIRTLEVRSCSLRDQGLMRIAEFCPSLRRIDIRGCGLITCYGIRALTLSVPGLESFNGACCVGVRDEALECLAEGYGETLTMVDVQRCWGVTTDGVRALAENCKRLESLNVRDCPSVTDAALLALAASPDVRRTLRDADFSGCDIGDDALDELVANCRELASVSVVGCRRVTPAHAARLGLLADVRITTGALLS